MGPRNSHGVFSGWGDSAWRWLVPALLLPMPCAAATYYVDATRGADSNTGARPSAAWRTLDRVNHTRLLPGDTVLFRSGQRWHGALTPQSSGTAGHPVRFDRYGEGALPAIDADGAAVDAVLLRNLQWIEVRHLAVSNHGAGSAMRRGVDIVLEDYGTAHHIVVDDLYVHDVNGTEEQKSSGGIAFRTLQGRRESRYDGLDIERNIVSHVDRSGIVGESSNVDRRHWFPSLDVVIADNYVADTGGDGIVPWATQGAVVDGNVCDHANQRAAQADAGIWQWSTEDTYFTMNESSFTKGTLDGEGFDSDYNSRNTRFYRNYSHDNDGGFLLICTPADFDPHSSAGNTGTLIQQNISRNDSGLLINLSGAAQVTVRDNMFYVGPQDHTAFLTSSWNGWSHDALFQGNRFYVQGTLVFGHGATRRADGSYEVAPGWGGAQRITLRGNTLCGAAQNLPMGVQAQPCKPLALDWDTEPRFSPQQPETYGRYLAVHRAWLARLFQRQFER